MWGLRRFGSAPWPLLCGICIGVLIAFPLAAPLMGGQILEPVATLWGNALGAIGAIAAAIWASDRASNLQRRQGASLILTFVVPIEQSLDELTYVYSHLAPIDDDALQPSHVLDPISAQQVLHLCHSNADDSRNFKKQIHRIEAVLTYLGPHEMQTYFALEAEMEKMDGVVSSLTHHAATSENQSFGHTPSTGLRTRLLQTNQQVRRHIRFLEKAAR